MSTPEGLAELHTHLGGSVATEIMWTLAHEQGIALPVKDYWEFHDLVTVSDPREVPDLTALDQIYKWTELIQSSPLPVHGSVPAAIAALRGPGARRARRRLPLAADHDARAPLQPDEAEPRRRARPRPHHHGLDPRARPRQPRVPAGARRRDPDDGPDIHRAAERDHRREGDPLRAARNRRHRHRRPTPECRRSLPLPHPAPARPAGARGRARRDDPRRRGRRPVRD